MSVQSIPRWVLFVNNFNLMMTQNLFGGKKFIKLAWAINLHKGLTPLVVIALIFLYRNFSMTAYVYLALHGSYAVCWLIKHFTFPDVNWEAEATLPGASFTFLLLGTYWLAPYLLVSRIATAFVPSWFLVFCIGLHTLGVVIMIAADCQKHFTLKYHKGLITNGLFRYSRHPNYLGEMIVYSSYALLAQHWIPWVVLAYWWLFVFFINMRVAEGSVSRYAEWEEYRENTHFLIPWIL